MIQWTITPKCIPGDILKIRLRASISQHFFTVQFDFAKPLNQRLSGSRCVLLGYLALGDDSFQHFRIRRRSGDFRAVPLRPLHPPIPLKTVEAMFLLPAQRKNATDGFHHPLPIRA